MNGIYTREYDRNTGDMDPAEVELFLAIMSHTGGAITTMTATKFIPAIGCGGPSNTVPFTVVKPLVTTICPFDRGAIKAMQNSINPIPAFLRKGLVGRSATDAANLAIKVPSAGSVRLLNRRTMDAIRIYVSVRMVIAIPTLCTVRLNSSGSIKAM